MNAALATKPHFTLREGEFVSAPRAQANIFDSGFRTLGEPAHRAASWYDRDMVTWRPRRGSADADWLPELDTVRGRSRDLGRNNGIARAMLQTIIDNVVGTGLRLSAKPDYKALGQTKEWADAWRANVQSRFQAYWGTTAIHSADTMNGDQLAALALRCELENGDGLGLLDWMPDRGDGFATKVRSIESDRLSNPMGEMDSPILRGGIKLDFATGAPVGYWFRNAHPGDAYLVGMYAAFPAWEFVPRRTSSGRLRVLHAFDIERPEQHRGKPLLVAVLPLFKQLSRYMDAELAAAVVNGMIAGIIETPMLMEDLVSMFGDSLEGRREYLQMRRDHAVPLESGSLIPVAPGDKVQPFLPQRPASGFGAFIENILRTVGASADLPYELVLKDFSKTNYSSARAALIEAWRAFLRRRDNHGSQWCDPIYWCWLEEQVNAGTVDAPGFYEQRAAYQRCKWIGPGRGWVDPMKEAMAAQIRIDSNISTLEDECAEQNRDWEENLEQRATELQRAQELNIPQVVSGRATIVPEDASQDPGVPTPGSGAPSNSAPVTGANVTTFDYRMEVPGRKPDGRVAELQRQVASLSSEIQLLAKREPTINVDARTTVNPTAAPDVQINVEAAKPADVQVHMDAPVTNVHLPARGAVEKLVVERDAEGRIVRTRENEVKD